MAISFTPSRPSAERLARHPGDTAHVFSRHRNYRDIWVHGDVFHIVMRQVLLKFSAECFDGALRVRRSNDKADVVL